MKDIGIDDAVIDVWVGNQNNMNVKVKNNNFNACAFFFGGFYFIYRKMYLIGILNLIITMFISSGILIFLSVCHFSNGEYLHPCSLKYSLLLNVFPIIQYVFSSLSNPFSSSH